MNKRHAPVELQVIGTHCENRHSEMVLVNDVKCPVCGYEAKYKAGTQETFFCYGVYLRSKEAIAISESQQNYERARNEQQKMNPALQIIHEVQLLHYREEGTATRNGVKGKYVLSVLYEVEHYLRYGTLSMPGMSTQYFFKDFEDWAKLTPQQWARQLDLRERGY